MIRQGQAKTGAYVASPAFPAYRYVWLRDGSFVAYGMDRAGQHESAGAFHRWVGRTLLAVADKVERLEAKVRFGAVIEPSEWLHCRYTVEGAEGEEGWGNFQLDGYGTWLWALHEHLRLTADASLLAELQPAVALVARYLTRFWDRPNFDPWEEHGEFVHPSSLACLYGGLATVPSWRTDRGSDAPGEQIRATCDQIGEICDQIKEYLLAHFVHDGRLTKFADGRSVDANLLWVTVPFGLLEPRDPLMAATVAEIERRCVTGGVHRYPEDTYYGGGEWLLLTAWLGWYYVRMGDANRARELLAWVEAMARPNGDLPEQVTSRAFVPEMVAPWIERWGAPACPLLWSHAMYLVLQAELAAHPAGVQPFNVGMC